MGKQSKAAYQPQRYPSLIPPHGRLPHRVVLHSMLIPPMVQHQPWHGSWMTRPSSLTFQCGTSLLVSRVCMRVPILSGTRKVTAISVPMANNSRPQEPSRRITPFFITRAILIVLDVTEKPYAAPIHPIVRSPVQYMKRFGIMPAHLKKHLPIDSPAVIAKRWRCLSPISTAS
jgi:hypothetical protein